MASDIPFLILQKQLKWQWKQSNSHSPNTLTCHFDINAFPTISFQYPIQKRNVINFSAWPVKKASKKSRFQFSQLFTLPKTITCSLNHCYSIFNVCDCYVCFHNIIQFCSSWISNIVINGMWLNNNHWIIFIHILNVRLNWVRDELTFNASDNDVAPESPILL